METKTIHIKVFKFEELSERAKEHIKRVTRFCFINLVKKDTLFLSNGTFFDKSGLKFLGLTNFDIEGEQ